MATSLTDEQLLSLPDWRPFTDVELRRAMHLAKRRARMTFNLLLARAEESGEPLPGASSELYARHCILIAREGQRCYDEWQDRRIIDWCGDPRVYWFCTLYDHQCRLRAGLPAWPTNQVLLARRASKAFAEVKRIEEMHTYNSILAAVLPPDQRGPVMKKLDRASALYPLAVEESMLALMYVNSRADTLVDTDAP